MAWDAAQVPCSCREIIRRSGPHQELHSHQQRARQAPPHIYLFPADTQGQRSSAPAACPAVLSCLLPDLKPSRASREPSERSRGLANAPLAAGRGNKGSQSSRA